MIIILCFSFVKINDLNYEHAITTFALNNFDYGKGSLKKKVAKNWGNVQVSLFPPHYGCSEIFEFLEKC